MLRTFVFFLWCEIKHCLEFFFDTLAFCVSLFYYKEVLEFYVVCPPAFPLWHLGFYDTLGKAPTFLKYSPILL